MDRGFADFERLGRFHEAGGFFVNRAKTNLKAKRRYSHVADRQTRLIGDQTVALTGCYSRKGLEAPLRGISKDPHTGKRLVFLTNNFALPALTITKLYYRMRRQIELFSNGSNGIYESRRSSARPRTQ
jgi:hypothetical protein